MLSLEDFKTAARIQVEWGDRPWGFYRPAAAPAVPGAQPKLVMVRDDDGKYRVPVREEDTPEYREAVIEARVKEAVTAITSKPFDEWPAKIERHTRGLFTIASDVGRQEIPVIMARAIAQLAAHPAFVAQETQEVRISRVPS